MISSPSLRPPPRIFLLIFWTIINYTIKVHHEPDNKDVRGRMPLKLTLLPQRLLQPLPHHLLRPGLQRRHHPSPLLHPRSTPLPIQVMFYLENNIDLCDTPLQEILRFVEVNLAFKGVDLDLLRRKILNQKNLLKRNRAKNRKNTPIIKKT